jgi:acetolactate synthase-1/2/3 large subunit
VTTRPAPAPDPVTSEGAGPGAPTAPPGAERLLRHLLDRGVDTCFTNPGTSEMHFVAALDRVAGMRSVLCLFEGVATGAADGYGRMAEQPAACLLHLGPGLGNGLANLHNARRAHTPLLCLVGDHARAHRPLDAPLTSDIEGLARPVSTLVVSPQDPAQLLAAADAALEAASGPPSGVATMIVPADLSWDPLPDLPPADPTPWRAPAPNPEPPPTTTGPEGAAAALRSGRPTAVLVGGRAARGRPLRQLAALAAAFGAKLLCETFPARLERGAGVPPVERLAYLAELAELQLQGLEHLVLVDAPVPVSFFAYPGRSSLLAPPGCQLHRLAGPADDAQSAVDALVELLGGTQASAPAADAERPGAPNGALDPRSMAQAVGATLPETAVVVDEGNTLGLHVPEATAGCPPHDWLTLTGGAIGMGLPLATGAALAVPDRPVLCLEADGSSLYTVQALWTQAREGLDVTTVLLDNRAYGILNFELRRVGAGEPGPVANALLSLADPPVDHVGLARSLGVPATTAHDAQELADALARAFAEPGPHLVHCPLPPVL